MIDLIDVHTHTLFSGHAYSTLQENVAAANHKGLRFYGVSDHAPSMPGGPHEMYFINFKVIPHIIDHVHVLGGVELSILNENGDVDLSERVLKRLDYAIASLHIPCMKPKSREENTMAYVNALLKHPEITIVGHPDDGRYPYDPEPLVRTAKETHTLLEVNNSSLSPMASRVNSHEILKDVLRLCVQYQLPIIIGSDAHISYDVGNHQYAERFLEELQFPTDLIVNYHEELIHEYLPATLK